MIAWGLMSFAAGFNHLVSHTGIQQQYISLYIFIYLSVHAPASEDYKDKQATPEEIVNAALKKGLKGIAVTDHQTADGWIKSSRQLR